MESKRKEDLFALGPLKSGGELGLGQGEGVAQMQAPIHIGVGKGHHKLGLALLPRIGLKNPAFSPKLLCLALQLFQSISFDRLGNDFRNTAKKCWYIFRMTHRTLDSPVIGAPLIWKNHHVTYDSSRLFGAVQPLLPLVIYTGSRPYKYSLLMPGQQP